MPALIPYKTTALEEMAFRKRLGSWHASDCPDILCLMQLSTSWLYDIDISVTQPL